MMKSVVIVNDLITGGGVENVMRNLVTYLHLKGDYKIRIVSNYKCNSFYEIYHSDIEYTYLYLDVKCKNKLLDKILKFVNEIYKKVKRIIILNKMFDIAIAIKEGPSMVFVSELKARKKLAWIHVDYKYMYWTKSIFKNKYNEIDCMSLFDHVVCVSEATKQSVISTIGDPGNLCVRYNPINFRQIIELSKVMVNVEPKQDKILFVSVGRMTDQKNFEMLVSLMAKPILRDKAELWLIGDGPNCSNIEKIIRDSKINNVMLLGTQNNPYKYLRQADCFVSSAVWESFGLAIQEAVVLGVPVISTRCSAIDEVLDKETGIIVENNADSLYHKLVEVVEDSSILNQYKERLKAYRIESFWLDRLDAIERLWI